MITNFISRVKQVLADLALSPIANRYVEDLTQSEYRRLTIGVSNYLIRNNNCFIEDF